MDTNKNALHVEGLEQDLGDLLAVFGRVHRRLGQDEAVVLGLALQVAVNRAVPILFDALPVADLARAQDVPHVVGRLVVQRLVADVEVQVWVLEARICNRSALILEV